MAMGKKAKAKSWPRVNALLDNEMVQHAIAELAAAAIVFLAAALRNSPTVRRKTAELKDRGQEKLGDLTDS